MDFDFLLRCHRNLLRSILFRTELKCLSSYPQNFPSRRSIAPTWPDPALPDAGPGHGPARGPLQLAEAAPPRRLPEGLRRRQALHRLLILQDVRQLHRLRPRESVNCSLSTLA